MTTDTALALLAEAEDAICILSDSIRDRTVSEYYSNLRDRITALLDSGHIGEMHIQGSYIARDCAAAIEKMKLP